MALTDKQRRFIEEYLVDLSATQAAIRAGYSKATRVCDRLRLGRRPGGLQGRAVRGAKPVVVRQGCSEFGRGLAGRE